MATIGEVQQELIKLHGQATSHWFASKGIEPSKLEILESSHTSGFWKSKNIIQICVAGGNIEDWHPNEQSFEHTIFYLEILEELIHEYQCKLKPDSSPTSRNLHSRFGTSFGGPGHGEDFFAAIEATASFFQRTPEELAKFLRGPATNDLL